MKRIAELFMAVCFLGVLAAGLALGAGLLAGALRRRGRG